MLLRALAVVALLAATARADDPGRYRAAQQLAEQGNLAWQAKDYRRALGRFQEAYQLFPSPKLHFNMALALGALGRAPEAAGEYERFLDEAADASPSARAAAQTAILELDRRLGRIWVTGADGAEARLDDGPAVRTPLLHPLRGAPGPHRLVVRRAGFATDQRTVELTAGETHRLTIELSAPLPVVASARPPESRGRWLVKRWWFWSAVGAVVTAAVIGGAVGGSQPHYPESKLGTVCPFTSGACP